MADRLVVVIGSDFGGTNKYNAEAGKDHRPIGSFLVTKKNQSWTNRVVGETEELHLAHKVNPATLQRDDAGWTLIYPQAGPQGPAEVPGCGGDRGQEAVPVPQHGGFAPVPLDRARLERPSDCNWSETSTGPGRAQSVEGSDDLRGPPWRCRPDLQAAGSLNLRSATAGARQLRARCGPSPGSTGSGVRWPLRMRSGKYRNPP